MLKKCNKYYQLAKKIANNLKAHKNSYKQKASKKAHLTVPFLFNNIYYILEYITNVNI